MDKFSYFSNAETEYIDNLYKQYLSDPESVDMSWRSFFEGFEFSRTTYGDKDKKLIVPNEFKVINLINEYRKRGHLFTRTNPVRTRRSYTPTLDIENFGLTKEDLDVSFEAGSEIGIGKAPLRKIIEHLEATYCRSIGVEYAHIRNVEIEQWLRNRMESGKNTPKFS
ncbi:MAG: 2-oxoglutarate dehydrogenase E1 subunit family protein, partial [Omnitrophica WOR_2 bacterium]